MDTLIKIALVLAVVAALALLAVPLIEPITEALAVVSPLLTRALTYVAPPLKFGRAILNVIFGSPVVVNLILTFAIVFPISYHALERSAESFWALLK